MQLQKAPVAASDTPRRRFAERVVAAAELLDDAFADRLVKAFAAVPREEFLADEYRTDPAFHSWAFEDEPLAEGFDRIGLRPSLVARILGMLAPRSGSKILEVGCGGGYQSALLAVLGVEVFSVERVGLLAQRARKTLDRVGFQRVLVRSGLSSAKSWPDHAPFDSLVCWVPVGAPEDLPLAQIRRTGSRFVTLRQEAPESAAELLFGELRGGTWQTYRLRI